MTATRLAWTAVVAVPAVNVRSLGRAALAALARHLVASPSVAAADATWFAANMTIGRYVVFLATMISRRAAYRANT